MTPGDDETSTEGTLRTRDIRWNAAGPWTRIAPDTMPELGQHVVVYSAPYDPNGAPEFFATQLIEEDGRLAWFRDEGDLPLDAFTHWAPLNEPEEI